MNWIGIHTDGSEVKNNKLNSNSNSMNRYPQGYYPKIQYWTELLQQAVQNNDIEGIKRCTRKVEYFTQRQHDRYVVVGGPTTS